MMNIMLRLRTHCYKSILTFTGRAYQNLQRYWVSAWCNWNLKQRIFDCDVTETLLIATTQHLFRIEINGHEEPQHMVAFIAKMKSVLNVHLNKIETKTFFQVTTTYNQKFYRNRLQCLVERRLRMKYLNHYYWHWPNVHKCTSLINLTNRKRNIHVWIFVTAAMKLQATII